MSQSQNSHTPFFKNKRYIVGSVLFILGLAFMFIPFIPLGYVFLAVASFLLYPAFPPLKKLLDYLKQKDDSNKIDKAQKKTNEFLGEDEKEENNKA